MVCLLQFGILPMKQPYRGMLENLAHNGSRQEASPFGKQENRSYLASLDGIRALSISLVFVAHVGFGHVVPGGFGVTVFFFLSGFLITTLLTREWDRYDCISLYAFYLRRVVRLGPPIAITLAASLQLTSMGLLDGEIDMGTIASQIFFFYNYYDLYVPGATTVDGLGVLWSLAVEEHFYLIWPVFFILLAKRQIGVRTIGVLLIGILFWRCIRLFVFNDNAQEIYVSTDTRFDSLLFGCLLALMVWKGQAELLFEPFLRAYALVPLSLAVLLLTFLFRDPFFRETLRYSLQGLALIPLFYYAVSHSDFWLYRPLNWKTVRVLGQWSYTIYLVHHVVIKGLVFNQFGNLREPTLIFLSLAISLALSALMHYVVERPLHPLRRRLVGHAEPR